MITSVRTSAPLLLTLLTVLAAGADSARADDVAVDPAGVDAPACGPSATPCKTLGYAVVNRLTAGPDTIKLSAGEHVGPGLVVNTANASGDVIQGAGTQGGGTVLTHSNLGFDPVLHLAVPMSVRGVSIRLPAGTGISRTGLSLGSAADGSRVDDVAVSVENASTSPAIVSDLGASDVAFDRLRVSGNHVYDGLNLHLVTGVTVQDAVLRGGTAPIANALSTGASTVTVRRSKLSRDFAAAGLDPVVEAISSQLVVESSLVTGGRVGFNSQAAPPDNAKLTLRGVTVDIANPGVADGGTDRHPIYVRTTMPGASSSTATVERSIFVEDIYTFVEAGSTVKVDCTDSLVQLKENATVACGAATGNAAAAPAAIFANAAGGDYHLKAGSPAVDGASPAPAAGESATDLDGNARALDGNGDCLVRVDRGAFELTGFEAPCAPSGGGGGPGPGGNPGVNQPPVLDRLSFARTAFWTKGAKKGTRLRFRLSESAQVAITIEQVRKRGRKTSYKKRGKLVVNGKAGVNSIVFSGRLGKNLLGKGLYRVRLLAKDTGGKASKERSASFRIVKR